MSGGSIPIGDEAISGTAVLPSGQPLTSAVVSASVVSSGQTVPVTSTLDTSGNFRIVLSAQTQDLQLTFVSASGTLQTVVPGSTLSTTAVDNIGSVTALTTIVAAAIRTEVTGNVDAPATIVSTQLTPLISVDAQAGGSQAQQTAAITSAPALSAAANNLITLAANAELTSIDQTPTTGTATIGLDGVLGYVVASGGAVPALNPGQRNKLIVFQSVRHKHTPTDIVSALGVAGVSTDANTVSAKDQVQQGNLPAFSAFGGVTTFEAVAIGSNPASHGGFGVAPTQGSNYVNALVGP